MYINRKTIRGNEIGTTIYQWGQEQLGPRPA